MCTAHEFKCPLVDTCFNTVGLWIDEIPLWQHHIEVFKIVFQRDVSMFIPVYVPCRAYSHAWISPFFDVFLRHIVRMTYETMLSCSHLCIVTVHLLFLEEVTERLVNFSSLVVF